MSIVSKALNRRIRDRIGYCPVVNYSRTMSATKDILVDNSVEQLREVIELIESKAYDSFEIHFYADQDATSFNLMKMESDDEYEKRIEIEEVAVSYWKTARDAIVSEFNVEQENKLNTNVKDDPEYAEYLRLKKIYG